MPIENLASCAFFRGCSAVSFALVVGCGSSSSPDAPADGSVPVDTGGDAAPLDARPEGGGDANVEDPPIDPKYQALADAIEAERKKMGAPGAAFALIEHGEVTFFHGFGTKGPSSTEPVRARTLFRIGSMTKSLTAATCLSLVDEGKMDTKALLKTYVPDIALETPGVSTLTVFDLLTHQGGLEDYLAIDGTHDDVGLSKFLTGSAFKTSVYFMAPPGSFWNYSNPNFYLAGLAAERASGVGYRQAVHDRILAPLGMNRTFFLGSEVVDDGDYANGKSTDNDGKPWDVAPSSYDNSWARPAGYAYSSVLDYARFVQFLHSGKPAVISDAQRAAMQSFQVDTHSFGSAQGYGYALFVTTGFRLGSSWYPIKLVSHGGDIPGFAADFYYVPSTGFGVVSFASADGAHFQTAVGLALQSFGELPASSTVPADAKPDPTIFPQYAGTYDDPHNVGTVTVSVTGGAVSISMPAVEAAGIPYTKALTPVTADSFQLAIQGTTTIVTFIKDAKDTAGAYRWLRTRQFVAQNSTALPPAHHIPVHVDAEALREKLHRPSDQNVLDFR